MPRPCGTAIVSVTSNGVLVSHSEVRHKLAALCEGARLVRQGLG